MYSNFNNNLISKSLVFLHPVAQRVKNSDKRVFLETWQVEHWTKMRSTKEKNSPPITFHNYNLLETIVHYELFFKPCMQKYSAFNFIAEEN